MRKWLLLIFIPINLVAQPYQSVDELAEEFIHALRKMETTEFKKLYPTDSVVVSNMDENLGFHLQDSLISDYTNIVKKGLELGIDWSKIRFIKAEYITTYDGPFLIAQPCVVIFQHRLFRYAININCSKINDSWGLVPIKRDNELIYLKKI